MNGISPYTHMSKQEMVEIKRRNRMNNFDKFDPQTRELINEYGMSCVTSLIAVGVTKPKQIKHIIETILSELSATRGSFSKQGKRTEVSQ